MLNALNTRLDPASIAFMLDHSGAKIFIADREFAECANAALAIAKVKPLVISYDDPQFPQVGNLSGGIDYEAFLSGGDPDFAWVMPQDEWDAISLNYTSGTTGNPKGVVCHHRGAALMGYANILACRMAERPVYLWTLPMFHCNGWCFPWTLALIQGTHVCLRWVRAKDMYAAIAEHKVTHLCRRADRDVGASERDAGREARLHAQSEFRACGRAAAGSHAARHAGGGF